MRAQKAGASGDDCPRPWHDYYRGDTEWKGKLILWRAHDISNTSRGPSPPTPTKSSDEGNLLQNCCGTAESCRSITLRERRESDRSVRQRAAASAPVRRPRAFVDRHGHGRKRLRVRGSLSVNRTDRNVGFPIVTCAHPCISVSRTPTSIDRRSEVAHLRMSPFLGLRRGGHAFIQNIRRGHYERAANAPPKLRVEAAFDELAQAV